MSTTIAIVGTTIGRELLSLLLRCTVLQQVGPSLQTIGKCPSNIDETGESFMASRMKEDSFIVDSSTITRIFFLSIRMTREMHR